MNKSLLANVFLLTVLLFGFAACDDNKLLEDNNDAFAKDRKEILQNLSERIVIPSYINFKQQFDAMQGAAEAFANNPTTENLLAYREAWTMAYVEWQKVELFDFGPGEKHSIRFFFNIYPASESQIAININNPNENLEVPKNFPAQGFPALDYLVNGIGSNDNEIIQFYTTAPDAAARIAYFRRIHKQMSLLLNTVMNEWNNSEIRSAFINNSSTNIGGSFSQVVNAYVLHYERYIRAGKIGIPTGVMVDGMVSPDKVEAYYKKDISKLLAQTAHQAAINFFNGKEICLNEDLAGNIDAFKNSNCPEVASLKAYLNAIGAQDASTATQLSELINTQFEVCNTKINELGNNFSEEVSTNNIGMRAVYSELQKTVRMLKVDMTSAMSVTITYADNDGD